MLCLLGETAGLRKMLLNTVYQELKIRIVAQENFRKKFENTA